jgi:hypothetical protein
MKWLALFLFLSLSFAQLLHAQESPTCSSFCVTGMYLDSVTPGQLWVSIAFNADSNVFINYPHIPSIIDGQGDTLATGDLWFFGQFGGTTYDYPVATDLTQLPGNLEATVNFSYDTVTCPLAYPCVTALTDDRNHRPAYGVAPNPFRYSTSLIAPDPLNDAEIIVYNSAGHGVHRIEHVYGTNIAISVSGLPPGMYILQIIGEHHVDAISCVILDD